MQSAPKVTALSVKLPIVLLRFTQRHSKALTGDASKLHRLKYYYPRPPPPRGQGQFSAYVYILLCECVFLCWTPTAACISSVSVCFHAGLPQSLYILLC